MRTEERQAVSEVLGEEEVYRRTVAEAEAKVAVRLRAEAAERRKRWVLRCAWMLLAGYAILLTLFLASVMVWTGTVRANANLFVKEEQRRSNALRRLLILHKIDPDPNWRDNTRSLKGIGESDGG